MSHHLRRFFPFHLSVVSRDFCTLPASGRIIHAIALAHTTFFFFKFSIHKNNEQDTTHKKKQQQRRSVSIFAVIIQRDRQCTAYKILLNSLLSRRTLYYFRMHSSNTNQNPTMQKFDDVHTFNRSVFLYSSNLNSNKMRHKHICIFSKLQHKLSHSTMNWIYFARQFATFILVSLLITRLREVHIRSKKKKKSYIPRRESRKLEFSSLSLFISNIFQSQN